ncbi:2-(3-amino-3-carboxypropyl)histidine synthase subunit [Candidatus Woesearchaeota archaeon]|nr:2-(3-amino-3-carboxypropyl)histidine synthase subunit [Candidatus Woesearchaeota archaeon]
MKTIFIEARWKGKLEVPDKLIDELPDKIALFGSVQFLDCLEQAKKKIESRGKKVLLLKTEHTKYPGQLLGCNIKEFKKEKQDFDAFLYIGDGCFHPKALVLKNHKPAFALNPLSKKYFKLEEKDVIDMKKKVKGALMKFMESKEIGVLISTKPGQIDMKKAYELEKKFPDKNFYFLIFDTIDFNELENFPFVECFVNTACPRISYDEAEKISKAVVDVDELD